ISSSTRVSLKALRLAGWLSIKVPMASEYSERMNIAVLLSITSCSDLTILVITHIFWASARKQQTRRLAAAAVCKAELGEGPCKAVRKFMGNHQNPTHIHL